MKCTFLSPSGTARGERQKAVGPLFITVSESHSIEYFPFVGCPASVPVPITPHLDRSPAPTHPLPPLPFFCPIDDPLRERSSRN
ncbi:hypothetical protein CDAR_496751 [Caerostris darwini]|uniref:Uncharacterized protein n=1 Tax=Caerostris darwini TaxID=1538125 RepID=A0AAV4U546_9ARAC|nr:hypothetical protein CDAR_496751 [Caerostris darwini]